MSDRPNPTRTAGAGERSGASSPGTRKVLGGLVAVNQTLTVWIPSVLAVVALVIGVATSSAEFIVIGGVLGIFAAYAWIRSLGTRDAPNGE